MASLPDEQMSDTSDTSDSRIWALPGWSLAPYLIPVAAAPPERAGVLDVKPLVESVFVKAEFLESSDASEEAKDLQDARDTADRYRRGDVGDFSSYDDYRRQRRQL